MDSYRQFARITLKTIPAHGFDHSLVSAANVRNVSKVGSQFLDVLITLSLRDCGLRTVKWTSGAVVSGQSSLESRLVGFAMHHRRLDEVDVVSEPNLARTFQQPKLSAARPYARLRRRMTMTMPWCGLVVARWRKSSRLQVGSTQPCSWANSRTASSRELPGRALRKSVTSWPSCSSK